MTDKAVPVLPSTDLVRTRKFYRYFGFEPVGAEPAAGDTWLRLRKDEVEIDFSLSEIDYTAEAFIRFGHVCVIRVRALGPWYESFARTRMDWKVLNPSLTRPRNDLWGGAPAFCLTDRDGNLIWCVESEGAA